MKVLGKTNTAQYINAGYADIDHHQYVKHVGANLYFECEPTEIFWNWIFLHVHHHMSDETQDDGECPKYESYLL